MRGFAPSRDGLRRAFGGEFFASENLGDAGAGVGAKFSFIAAGLQRSCEKCGRDRDLRGQGKRMEIHVAQLLVATEGAFAVEDFAARADQVANSFRLVADFKWTSGEAGQKKKLINRIEARCEGWTEYIQITQWQCVIEYSGGGERIGRARIRNQRETVLGRKRDGL